MHGLVRWVRVRVKGKLRVICGEMDRCMFAVHYFFASETALRHFLTTVAANLRPGSPLVCTPTPAVPCY